METRTIELAKDPGQRQQQVRDMRVASDKAAKERRSREESKILDECDHLVDKAWSEAEVGFGNTLFAGFGPGRPMGTGRYLWRDGKWVKA
jgi:hypothetical protein